MTRSVLLGAVLAGLSVGCISSLPPPHPPQVLGLVEFTFEDNSTQIQSVARWLQTTPKINQISLSSSHLPVITAAGSATTSDLNGQRYLSAAFNVQNPQAGLNYNNLSFYAVTVDSTIGGVASLGGTSLRNLRDANGAVIVDADVARGVKPTHKLVNFAGVMRVDSSGADFQVFDPATEVAAVQQAMNAIPTLNAHVTALGYGFVARRAANNPARSISAGQSGFVTLGLHFPISTHTSRFMSLTYVVVNDTATRVTEALEEQGTNSGATTRAQALGSDVGINVLPGSSLTGERLICPVRWATQSGTLPELITACVGTPPVPATYLVGPTRTFKTLQAVMSSLKPGDIVDVDGDATYPSLKFTASGTDDKPILIRGTLVNNHRPIIQGFAQASGFAAVKFVASNHVIFDSFEITNGPSADKTATTACVFNEANDVTLRHVKVRDCPNHGILGADTGSGSLNLEEVEVTSSGCDISLSMTCNGTALKHPIYVATDPGLYPGATLRIVNSYLHDNKAGENIKTRAERVQIYNNWLETSSAQYRNLGLYGYQEYTAGVDAPTVNHDVIGNVIVERGSSSVMRTGGDGTGSTRGRTRFVNNTVILDSSFENQAKPVIRLDGDLEAFAAVNNVFHVISGTTGVLLIYENADLAWVAQPKVLVSNSNLASGSVYLRTVNGATYGSTTPLPSGYRFENITSDTPQFVNAASLDQLELSLLPGSKLKGAGTPAFSPSGYEIAWGVTSPERNAIVAAVNGEIQLGAPRTDAAAPSIGAYQ